MLILSRKQSQSFCISTALGDVWVHVEALSPRRVKLAIDAPDCVRVRRGEVRECPGLLKGKSHDDRAITSSDRRPH